MPGRSREPHRILHILRAPVGGLFRHVVDLARGQAAQGCRVGIIADLSTGGAHAEAILADLATHLALGVSRVAMSRHIGISDLLAVRHVSRRIAETAANTIHGHGAKGGAYARLAAGDRVVRVYTPHGGSLHYGWGSPAGLLYLSAERRLKARTDLFLFESAFGRDAFAAKVGQPAAIVRVVHNGVAAAEFAPIAARPDATDLVFVGELRALKGIDLLIESIAVLAREGRIVSATIIGDGPDAAAFQARTRTLGLATAVRFLGAMPARIAFAHGRILVVPSRAESLPYVVLEAAAAGLPMVATNVGGIPEIFGPAARRLVAPGDPAALAHAIAAALDDASTARAAALRLRERVRGAFSVDAMTGAVLAAYSEAMARRNG